MLCPGSFKQELPGQAVQKPLKGSTGARQEGSEAVLVHVGPSGRGGSEAPVKNIRVDEYIITLTF